MKSFLLKGILISLVIFGLTSCDGDDDLTDNGVGSGKITATINGEKIEFEEVQGVSSIGKIAISGTKGEKVISIMINDDISVGTYNTTDHVFTMTYTENNGDTGLISMEGTLEVTKHDENGEHVTGTFNIIFGNYGYDGSTSAQGSFDINYVSAL